MFKFYLAMAYKYLAESQLLKVQETQSGYGKLITLWKITVGKLNEAKKFVQIIGG